MLCPLHEAVVVIPCFGPAHCLFRTPYIKGIGRAISGHLNFSFFCRNG
jgi:hypothetical protein